MMANSHTSVDSAPLFTPDCCGSLPIRRAILQYGAPRLGASSTPLANR
jgi:hypothetical protein